VRQILTTLPEALDLLRLKLETDSKGSYHSLHKLVFQDVKSADERRLILDHIEKQGRSIVVIMKQGGRTGITLLEHRPWRKILSDIDDTLKCSGGHWPAGVDLSLPRKAVYPGVLGLYRELDLGCCAKAESWEDAAPGRAPDKHRALRRDVGNLAFLSARPHVYRDWAEKGQYSLFSKMCSDGAMHAMPSMLTGDLASGYEFVRHGNFTPLAQKKYEGFKQFAMLYPEFRFIFIGDNGQGDVRAAEMMLDMFPDPAVAGDGDGGAAARTLGHRVDAVYIHVVQKGTFGRGDPVRILAASLPAERAPARLRRSVV